jgi:hypothetical protein
VPFHDHTPYNHPLDVLRRFMPSPLKALVEFEKDLILVETNDLSFLLPLGRSDSQSSTAASPAFHWKLLRDADASGKLAEAAVLMAGTLLVVNMGPACLAGVDMERKELLAFIGGEVDPQEYQKFVFPVLRGLTQFAMGKESTIGIPFPNELLCGNTRNA